MFTDRAVLHEHAQRAEESFLSIAKRLSFRRAWMMSGINLYQSIKKIIATRPPRSLVHPQFQLASPRPSPAALAGELFREARQAIRQQLRQPQPYPMPVSQELLRSLWQLAPLRKLNSALMNLKSSQWLRKYRLHSRW